ncbi:MAG: hypothetical protein M5U19_07405 [Microthrixaceae bacterium]|nr:hypothetical protein [Microthrixaceae bacterium]
MVGGDLYLPVGDPIDLPTLEIDGDATWSHTFTASGLDLGPALRTSNNPSFTLSLADGVLVLDLDETLYVERARRQRRHAAPGAPRGIGRHVRRQRPRPPLGARLPLRHRHVRRQPLRGRVRMMIPSNDPVSVDLGPVNGSVHGSVYSDGDFDFSGDAVVDLTRWGGVVGHGHRAPARQRAVGELHRPGLRPGLHRRGRWIDQP